MKKVLLAVIISSACSVIAKGQSRFSFGPNAGVGASWLDNTANRKTKLAGNAGLSLVYSAAPHFGLGLDGKYSFEGGKYTQGGQPVTADLDYIRVPLKAIYFFGKYGNAVRPKVYVGPSFGFLVGGETTIERGALGPLVVKSKDYYRSFDFGVTAGAGLNIRLVKNTWFNADASYLHGVTDIRKPEVNQHNRNIGANVGVNFGL